MKKGSYVTKQIRFTVQLISDPTCLAVPLFLQIRFCALCSWYIRLPVVNAHGTRSRGSLACLNASFDQATLCHVNCIGLIPMSLYWIRRVSDVEVRRLSKVAGASILGDNVPLIVVAPRATAGGGISLWRFRRMRHRKHHIRQKGTSSSPSPTKYFVGFDRSDSLERFRLLPACDFIRLVRCSGKAIVCAVRFVAAPN
jgi:hypothetical protein